ncbi:hypothetical protein GCM10025867_02060 [Frondihabitans sucicola]|uniref:Extracellular solute-binding protein n=1 Tax=Frondihabitans sucicola TaxID=1268041 RepID=A0ABM8GHX3_9MICO|nr:extracellular solute-binding protein [Frondihabitans sucicola]BDZ47965.1 hypothetical protein GCM10025867_02060 [Frondihabitans sucicola]
MKRKSKVLAALALAAAVVVPLSSCSSPSSAQAGNEKVTLSMWGFSPLYKPQVKEYEKLHPNVTIQQKIGDYDASHQALLTALNANKGPDIAQIAIDYAPEFTAVPAAFLDLRTLGAAKIKKDYLDWRWQGGVASNGSVVGIPTDVGGSPSPTVPISSKKPAFRPAPPPSAS